MPPALPPTLKDKANQELGSIVAGKLFKPRGNLKQRLEAMRPGLENARSSFLSHWQDISSFLHPYSSRFLAENLNNGLKRNSRIINETGTLASDVLAAGMMSGITSPARQWFRLKTADDDLNELDNVQSWLSDSTQRLSMAIGRTDYYTAMQQFYQDLGDYATACLYAEEDMHRVARFKCLPVGSYCFARGADGLPNTLLRTFQWTPKKMLQEFGQWGGPGGTELLNPENFSPAVKNNETTSGGNYPITVVHWIVPNDQYVYGAIGPAGKRFLSVYYELGTVGSQTPSGAPGSVAPIGPNQYLWIGGYDDFPCFISTWKRAGEDDYGTSSPGMVALGSIKQLQKMEKVLMKATEKLVDPPMQGPPGTQAHHVNMLPGTLSIADATTGGKAGLTPLHEVRLELAPTQQKIQQIESKIDEIFQKKFFLMMMEGEHGQMTATEVNERAQEKMMVLGPVLEQLNQGVLDPMIAWFFKLMLKRGLLKPPPEQVMQKGQLPEVEYLSIMAQAQKALGLAGQDKFGTMVLQMAPVAPDVVSSVDWHKYVTTYGDFAGLHPGILLSADKVAAIKQAQAQAAQAQQQQEAMVAKAQAASKLGSVDTSKPNALSDLINQGRAGALTGAPGQ